MSKLISGKLYKVKVEKALFWYERNKEEHLQNIFVYKDSVFMFIKVELHESNIIALKHHVLYLNKVYHFRLTSDQSFETFFEEV